MRTTGLACGLAGFAAALLAASLADDRPACADEPVVTTVADYEDESVAAYIDDVRNVLAEDCRARLVAIPARGQRALMVEIGATRPGASVACDLRFRLTTAFEQLDRVATHAWINEGQVALSFRLRDAADRVFETPPTTLRARHRWVRIVAELSDGLRMVSGPVADEPGPARPQWPLEVLGYRVSAQRIGRQTVYLDDLEVEHRVAGSAILRGEFRLDTPTHIYEPGALVRAALVLENRSPRLALPLTVELSWLRLDGSRLATAQSWLNLPARGSDYRSRQPVDFSRQLSEPGLYRLQARVSNVTWPTPAEFDTAVAVTWSNRGLPRGRATFFGVQTNLLSEPPADQMLELEIAKEIGAQLVALQTPWRLIEPRPGRFDFAALDGVIDRAAERDMAAMIVLAEPPPWLPGSPSERWERQAALLEALTSRYGRRVVAYQTVGLDQPTGQPTATELAAAARLQQQLAAVQPHIEVYAPPIRIPAGERELPALLAAGENCGARLGFLTTGDSPTALARLAEAARGAKLHWQPTQRWFHHDAKLPGVGGPGEAVAVLRHYVEAAAAGVSGLVWFDLRDDTSDPRHPERMRGLLRRDFSPKAALLGFANAVGMLNGLLYAGRLSGTPDEFDSALFIGGNRQVAVLFPRPNRILPAVLAPRALVPGELGAAELDRRPRALTRSIAGTLLPTSTSPLFITLDTWRAQSEPRLILARPWLRLPSVLPCGQQASLRIELDAPVDLRRSYVKLILPDDAPVRSSLSARRLRANAGETVTLEATLTRRAQLPFEPTELLVHLSLEGDTMRFPVRLQPLYGVQPCAASAAIAAAPYLIDYIATAGDPPAAGLTPPGWARPGEGTKLRMALYAAYDERYLHLALGVPEVSEGSSAAGTDRTFDVSSQARVQLGMAVADDDFHARVRIDDPFGHPRVSAQRGTDPRRVEGWRCRRVEVPGSGAACQVSVPRWSLPLGDASEGRHLLVAVRFEDPRPPSGGPAVVLEWEGGVGGSPKTWGYRWLKLVPPGR